MPAGIVADFCAGALFLGAGFFTAGFAGFLGIAMPGMSSIFMPGMFMGGGDWAAAAPDNRIASVTNEAPVARMEVPLSFLMPVRLIP
jgi:hypothetical protein